MQTELVGSSVLTHNLHRKYNGGMKKTRGRSRTREPRVSRTYRLPLTKLAKARRALGTANDTETIERALDLAVFGEELAAGAEAMFGIDIVSPDPEP